MELLDRLLRPDILGVMIPIVAILMGGSIAILRMWTRHRERLAMIDQGMHPDAHREDEREEEEPVELELGRRKREGEPWAR